MSLPSDSSSNESNQSASRHSLPRDQDEFEGIDLREVFSRLMRGFAATVGLALLGLVIAMVAMLATNRFKSVTTSTRVVFSFNGFDRNEYPDHSKFQPDDLKAPDVVRAALKQQGLNPDPDTESKIRAAISIAGIIPDDVTKALDLLRASGQNPPVYQPDEYSVTLTLPRSFALNVAQRNRLLDDLVSVFREKFMRTYGQPALTFGTALDTLKDSDYPEYELVLNTEINSIQDYLTQQIALAPSFRSPTTNLTFKDLQDQTELFGQLRLNDVLGLIHEYGLTHDRDIALMKLNYYLHLLDERDHHAVEDESVVRDLLTQEQAHTQGYVLGIKSQVAQQRNEPTVLDQGLINSLLANDAYNFLVHRDLDAGLKVKEIQAEQVRVTDIRDNLKSFSKTSPGEQASLMGELANSLAKLKTEYLKLIDGIRKTQADFAQQQFGNAIRLSDQTRTPGMLRPLAIAGIVGAFLGAALGVGLSLLGIYIGSKET
jgi:hypothetical protein